MFASATAEPASTVTTTAATTADTMAFRDNHFFIVFLLEINDPPPSCVALDRGRRDSMRRSMGVHNGLQRTELQVTRGHSGHICWSRVKWFCDNDVPAVVTCGQDERAPLDRPRGRAYKESSRCREQGFGSASVHSSSTRRLGS